MSDSASTPGVGPLPPELIIAVMEHLQYRDLLSCRLLSSTFRHLIDTDSSLQYKIELAIVGMVDNLDNPMISAEKLAMLRQYRSEWSNISLLNKEKQLYPLHDGPAWELVGGVLAQSIGPDVVEFLQLPSRVRGVPEKTWKICLPCNLVDFTIDPGQDLLVLLEQIPLGQRRGCVHLLSMSTGKYHPLAKQRIFEYECQHFGRPRYEIRINGPYLGLLVTSWDNIQPTLAVWDWCSGSPELAYDGHEMYSFAFVSDTFLLVCENHAEYESEEPALVLVDIGNPSRRWKFLLPRIAPQHSLFDLELLCEPGAMWSPPEAETPAFHVTQAERLIVLNIRTTVTVTFSILASKLLAHAVDLGPKFAGHVQVDWDDWGPSSCRTSRASYWEGQWPCVVYGTKHVFARNSTQENGEVKHTLIIQDFNQNLVRYEHLSSSSSPPSSATVYMDNTVHRRASIVGQILDHDAEVTTCLPYLELTVPCNLEDGDTVMITEDSIVIVKDARHPGDFLGFEVYSL